MGSKTLHFHFGGFVCEAMLRRHMSCVCSLPAAAPYLWLLLTCSHSLPVAAPYLWPLLT